MMKAVSVHAAPRATRPKEGGGYKALLPLRQRQPMPCPNQIPTQGFHCEKNESMDQSVDSIVDDGMEDTSAVLVCERCDVWW